MREFVSRMGDALRRQRRYRQTLSELNAMSDAEANDLGLRRSDFPALAARAAFGR